MSKKNRSIMDYESVLPPDFDGFFRFSNPSNEDFIGVWAGREYLFPKLSTVPIVIPEHSPIEVQHIRKKFAKDLAEREFYKSKSYKEKRDQEGKSGNRIFNSIHQAATYTLSDLEPYIQACLKPLAVSKLVSKPAEKVRVEDKLHLRDDGSFNTEVLANDKISLKKKALEA
jgi:hypothetical protein